MASTCKCEYCGSTILTSDQTCPNCGAANPLFVIDTEKIVTDPQTIEELQEYCAERGMPLARMRFFIGEDFKEPKAFGIYRDNRGDVVVYKNKADGSRAIRYKGKDERHAVNEIYGKLLEECHNRGIYPDGKSSTPYMANRNSYSNTRNSRVRVQGSKSGRNFSLFIILLTIIILAVYLMKGANHPSGYYRYDDTMYYHIGNSWYYYDDTYNDWYGVDNSVTDTIYDGGKDYYYDDGWNSSWGESFYDSNAYESYQESHSSSSDDSYDSYDSWDSGSTDWSSDW
ncbi:MAG: hypothetical protein K6E47_09240 [Lachnospiraceae bacterium]|nr:hypothetical protein [Lachnospiraceae bacterium]